MKKDTPAPRPGLLTGAGNYQNLLSYQKSAIIFDLTYHFTLRFLARGDRTIDQMVQAARSGKQNIIEGNSAAMTSKEMGIKLTNVARASLDELLEDYLDFLRVRDLPLWPPESREALYVRDLGRRKPQTYDLYRGFVDTRDAAIVANIAICLIFQARYLLDRQLLSQGNAFIEKGGLRERMTQARQQHRGW